jgi:hypothetical protein
MLGTNIKLFDRRLDAIFEQRQLRNFEEHSETIASLNYSIDKLTDANTFHAHTPDLVVQSQTDASCDSIAS